MSTSSTSQLFVLVVGALVLGTQAAAIRNATEVKEIMETTTVPATTEEIEVTTVQAEDYTTADPVEGSGALSRDEEASILIIDQTLLDPAPADSKQSADATLAVEKSANLFLLSSPRLAEKPKLPEENIEESEELEDTAGNSTDSPIETTTLAEELSADTTTVAAKAEEKTEQPSEATPTTKLFPINDTLYEDMKKLSPQPKPEPPVVVVADEEPKDVKNSNLASVVLTEAEVDYVLVDADAEVLEEGVYADADSELHLQPIVQSLEIVPSSVDDSLLVNYVHTW